MTYYTHTEKPIGNFIEKQYGNNFEYSFNDEQDNYSIGMSKDYPHRVWVGDFCGHGWRYARVLKTIAYVVTDEDDDGSLVVQKWNLKSNINYKEI